MPNSNTITARARQRFDFPEYLQFEKEATHKHEFLDGTVWAMAIKSIEHVAIAGNTGSLLRKALSDRRNWQVFTSDLKIHVLATGLVTYPDVSVVYGKLQPGDADSHFVTNPIILVEVINPSSEQYTRGEKLDHYRQIESLVEVLLISQEPQHVEVWRRSPDRTWHWEEITSGAVPLQSIDSHLPLAEIFYNPFA